MQKHGYRCIACPRNFFHSGDKSAVTQKLEELNNREFKQRVGSRRTAYLNEEKMYMLPLPASDFEPAIWSTAKVGVDYLITDGRNKYSVPSKFDW